MWKIASILLLTAIALSEGFENHLLTTGFSGPSGIQVTDMNLDGIPDVLGSAWNAGEISYWLNSGGVDPEWSRHLVTDSLTEASFCSAGDVNGDGFIDVAASGWEPGRVLVFLGSSNGSWTEYVITNSLEFAHEVHLVDIDLDGALDVVAAAAGPASIVWWRNNGSTPDLWEEHVLSRDLTGGRSVCTADFDEDGDIDIAGCGMICDDIRWWENPGDLVSDWTEHAVDVYFNGAHMIRAEDINTDGHIDIIGVGFIVGKPGVWLNSGTVPVEWDKHLLADNIGQALGVDHPDLNCDGLPDLAATSQNPRQLSVWINNGGSPSTWDKNLVDGTILGAWPLGSGDFNEDGYIDLTAGGNGAGFIRWYENLLASGVSQTEQSPGLITSASNPARGCVIFTVQSEQIERIRVSVSDLAGRTVCEIWEGVLSSTERSFSWDGTNSSEGVYLIRAESSSGALSVRKVTLLN